MPRRRRLLLLLLPALVLLVRAGPARADVREDENLNYLLETPEGWAWDPPRAEWGKFGIVVGAIRRLEHLKDGSTGKGEGALVHLAITDAPEGKTVEDLAGDAEVRAFLLGGFRGTPKVEVIPDELEGLEMRILRVEGTGPNLDGRDGKALGVMLMIVCRGKLYRLRMYAWPTKFDDEGLKDDLDLIEVQFTIPNTKPLETHEGGEPPPPPPEADPTEELPGDAGQEVVFQDPIVGWKIVKPVKIQSAEIDKTRYRDMVAFFQAADSMGSYTVTLSAHQRGKIVDGVRQADLDMRDWITAQWWRSFNPDHPEGEVFRYEWPRARPNETFITLPDFGDPKVVASKPSRRIEDPSASDMMRKMRVVEKVEGRLGEERISQAFRGAMGGARPRLGPEIELRYAWMTEHYTFLLTVTVSTAVLPKYGEPLRQLLESIEMISL